MMENLMVLFCIIIWVLQLFNLMMIIDITDAIAFLIVAILVFNSELMNLEESIIGMGAILCIFVSTVLKRILPKRIFLVSGISHEELKKHKIQVMGNGEYEKIIVINRGDKYLIDILNKQLSKKARKVNVIAILIGLIYILL